MKTPLPGQLIRDFTDEYGARWAITAEILSNRHRTPAGRDLVLAATPALQLKAFVFVRELEDWRALEDVDAEITITLAEFHTLTDMVRAYEGRLRAAERHEAIARMTDEEKHDAECHPDYEYACTETARKSGDSLMPPGEGWEPNDKIVLRPPEGGSYRRNWERFEFTEIEYWRRRKSAPEGSGSP